MKLNYIRPSFWLASIAILAIQTQTSVYAQSSPSASSPAPTMNANSDDMELLLADDPIVTTVTRTAERLSDSPAAVTVITADDIAKSGATTIPELLRSVPGVDVEQPNETQTNVSIRGFNQLFANKLLVMVDGRSIYQDIYGSVFWNTEPLLLSRIERIEIVRGPGSVLYGANAFNGVINIITKTPAEMAAGKVSTTYTISHGEQNSNFDEATLSGGKTGNWAATLGLGYHSTLGFMPSGPGQPTDSSRVPMESLDIQKQLPEATLTLSGANSDAKSDVLSELYLPDATFHTSDAKLTYAQDAVDSPITASVYSNFFRIAGPEFYVSTVSDNMELQQERHISATEDLIYGASYRYSGFDTTITGPQGHSETLAGYYIQDQISLGNTTNLFLGTRLDHNSLYGYETSPRVSIVQHLKDNQTIRASYSTAYQAPSDFDTYLIESEQIAPGFDEEITGNTNLKPTKIASTEVGYRRDSSGGYVSASIFDDQVTDQIIVAPTGFAPSPPFPPGTPAAEEYENGDNAQVTGFELEGGFTMSKTLHGLLNYSYQDAIDTQQHVPIDLSPDDKLNLVLNDSWGRMWTGYMAVHYVSASTFTNEPVIDTVPAYTTVDAKIGYRLGSAAKPLTVSVSATNLFNDVHRELPEITTPIGGFNESALLGRTGWVSVDGHF